jgi:hypothetical protein
MEQEKQIQDDQSLEIHQFWHLTWTGITIFGFLGLCLWGSPYFFAEDPVGLYRYVLLKTPIALVSIWLIIASACIFDFITPKDSLETIASDPLSSSILYAALFLALSITMAFG